MKEQYRIAVLGIGGVGGFFGGKLAKYFTGSNDIEIIFVARGENAKVINETGLRVITTTDEFLATPTLVSNEPSEIGEVDVFLICTKAYDLTESINKYQACIGENTVILPLLNGVDHAETISQILPKNEVWNGCVFIVANLVGVGIVKIDSEIRLLQFGSKSGTPSKMNKFLEIVKESGINIELSNDIDRTVWEKFIFISSLATITSFSNCNIGEVVKSIENMELLKKLISEVNELAQVKRIKVAENIEEIVLGRIKSSPPESTSSMHNDFKKKGETELETLTGYVVKEAKLNGLSVPTYERMYEELKRKAYNK